MIHAWLPNNTRTNTPIIHTNLFLLTKKFERSFKCNLLLNIMMITVYAIVTTNSFCPILALVNSRMIPTIQYDTSCTIPVIIYAITQLSNVFLNEAL